MHPQQPPRRIPKINFRVLIIGRANSGKTSILQRVCDTTDSPIIYRDPSWRNEEITLDPSVDRGEHTIEDELVFSNHRGYIFHDSRGIESGSTDELGILQKFIQSKYCVPMDNQRPELDLRFFKGICSDQNVPVIAVFTKYDQFRKNIRINVEDFGSPDDDVSQVTEEHFQEYYLRPLGDGVRFVRLEKMHMQDMRCDELIETTAGALNEETTALMLLAVQRGNLELSVKTALKRVNSHSGNDSEGKHIVRECLIPFPYIWYTALTLDAAQLLVGEYQFLLTVFKSTNLTALLDVSGCRGSLRFEPADDACPRLSRSEWLPWLAAFSSPLTTPVLGSPETAAVALCVSSPLTTPVSALQFFVSGCRGSLRFKPADDACPRLSSCEWLPWLAAFQARSRRLSSALQLFVSGCRGSLRFKPTDDPCPRLSRT
ncbi:hypothetical protein EDB85DRAFT_2293107 [Lactarius pseudohatsudake]|nr:hypothetical protein EDB85DRAFT_2293107 [Lactarius pseudohatsudake]